MMEMFKKMIGDKKEYKMMMAPVLKPCQRTISMYLRKFKTILVEISQRQRDGYVTHTV